MNTRLIFTRVRRYLIYLIRSQNRSGHGIHSPFVYDLVTRVFANKPDPSVVSTIESIRVRLTSDPGVIEVNDLGTGSGSRKDKLKKVSDIARDSAVPAKYGKLLANMAAEYGRPLVIEFGTSFGISTMYMASSIGNCSLFTMEGCTATAGIAARNFREAQLNNIRIFTGSFEDSLSEILSLGIRPGLVFMDGNHRKKPVLDYFARVTQISDLNTVVIIDDIEYSSEMEEAWSEIKRHEKVTLTIDIFRMGIVFFRKGIGRRDYIICY